MPAFFVVHYKPAAIEEPDEAFKEKLHPSVQPDYIECLEEKRREDEYEERA